MKKYSYATYGSHVFLGLCHDCVMLCVQHLYCHVENYIQLMFCLWLICKMLCILFNSIWIPGTSVNLTYCFLGSILCSWPTNFNGRTIAVVHRLSACRKRVRFDRAAEFLAACASEDTEEATLMLQEAKETKRRNGEDVGEIINCSNADGITALHQVRPVPPLPLRFNWNYGLMQRWV